MAPASNKAASLGSGSWGSRAACQATWTAGEQQVEPARRRYRLIRVLVLSDDLIRSAAVGAPKPDLPLALTDRRRTRPVRALALLGSSDTSGQRRPSGGDERGRDSRSMQRQRAPTPRGNPKRARLLQPITPAAPFADRLRSVANTARLQGSMLPSGPPGFATRRAKLAAAEAIIVQIFCPPPHHAPLGLYISLQLAVQSPSNHTVP